MIFQFIGDTEREKGQGLEAACGHDRDGGQSIKVVSC